MKQFWDRKHICQLCWCAGSFMMSCILHWAMQKSAAEARVAWSEQSGSEWHECNIVSRHQASRPSPYTRKLVHNTTLIIKRFTLQDDAQMTAVWLQLLSTDNITQGPFLFAIKAVAVSRKHCIAALKECCWGSGQHHAACSKGVPHKRKHTHLLCVQSEKLLTWRCDANHSQGLTAKQFGACGQTCSCWL